MINREFHYEIKLELASSLEAFWPFVSDTNRFNQDAGMPPVRIVKRDGDARLVEMKVMGMRILWREIPFDWVAPNRFGLSRVYLEGPLQSARITVELTEKPKGGTVLHYQIWVRPANLLGFLTIPFSFGVDFLKRAENVFKMHDRLAMRKAAPEARAKPVIPAAAKSRIETLRGKLLEKAVNPDLAERFLKYLQESEDFSVQRIRPYVLAEAWKVPRREMLEMFLFRS